MAALSKQLSPQRCECLLCVLASLSRWDRHALFPIIGSIIHDIPQRILPAMGYGGTCGSNTR